MNENSLTSNYTIGIIGLGYVGLPLAVAFGQKFRVIGFDINAERVSQLLKESDQTGEMTAEEIRKAGKLQLSVDRDALSACNVFIITVPTPLDADKKPDLRYLLDASELVAAYLKQGDIVIYESTVYPGCTEEDCVPVLERKSGLRYNKDFFCGYSPERINPGDKVRRLADIIKITSGSDSNTAAVVDSLYASIITAGTYKAPSIRVAEAAKAIENAQRDVNISFMNELSLIFDKMGIDTGEVLAAASTKWNFLPFKPGLVGGHCIGVDPHYLAFKAMSVGYEPRVILSGREVNEQMGFFVAEKAIGMLKKKHGDISGRSVLILGFSFKENCADTRNTKVIDVFQRLAGEGLRVVVHDPLVDSARVQAEYGVSIDPLPAEVSDLVIVAVAHEVFKSIDFGAMKAAGAMVFDTKGLVDRQYADGRL
jgi:UDP-N-acetyl-D-galactosamine dehydrogenase